MKSEIILIVEEFDKNGMFRTIEDQFRDICGSSNPWYRFTKKLWNEMAGDRIKFQTYSTIDKFDPNIRYFYFCPIYIHGLDWFKFHLQIKDEQYRRMVENNVAIIFAEDCEVLPFLHWEALKNILELLWDRKVYPDAKIYFLSAGKLIPNNESYLDFYFYGRYKFLYSPLIFKRNFDEFSGRNDHDEIFNEYINSNKDFQFLNLNLHPRFHRKTFAHALRSNNLMNQGISSYGREENIKYNIDHLYCSNKEFYDLLKKDMEQPIGIIKADDVNPNDSLETSLTIPRNLMNITCYDIVAETAITYDRPHIFDQTILTEKIFKSLYYCRPFMINGGPYTLKLLKELGFKTFDFLFDETYDQMENLLDRQEAIITNIKRYENQTDKIMNLVKANMDVLEYNRNHLINFDFEDYFVNMFKSL